MCKRVVLHTTIAFVWGLEKDISPCQHPSSLQPVLSHSSPYEAAQAAPGAAGAGLAAPRDAQLRPHHLRPHAQRQAQGVPAANTDY